MVGGEVGSGGVVCPCHIGLVWQSGSNTVIYDETEGDVYSICGGGILCWWQQTLLVMEAEEKRVSGCKF